MGFSSPLPEQHLWSNNPSLGNIGRRQDSGARSAIVPARVGPAAAKFGELIDRFGERAQALVHSWVES